VSDNQYLIDFASCFSLLYIYFVRTLPCLLISFLKKKLTLCLLLFSGDL